MGYLDNKYKPIKEKKKRKNLAPHYLLKDCPRTRGTNPRALGMNPRALGTNPRALNNI